MSPPESSFPGSLHRLSIPRPLSMTTHVTSHTYKSNRSKHRGFGGFPMPHEIVHGMFSRFFPSFKRKLTRSVTMPHSTTLASIRGDGLSAGDRSVNYITFSATVGRNSVFRDLSDEQARELGNVELRALGALLWIVAGVRFNLSCPLSASDRCVFSSITLGFSLSHMWSLRRT